MGSRISISLVSLLHNERIVTKLSSIPIEDQDGTAVSLENSATVTFTVPPILEHPFEKEAFVFDVVLGDGHITLERDFNYFRHPVNHALLMRLLFETGVSFEVFVG